MKDFLLKLRIPFLCLISFVLILYSSKDLIFNPTLFMDEGYYLGATHSILNGDWFLRGYSFDKPFLLAFWPLPGVVLFGENPFGFRIIAIICYLASFVFFLKTLEKNHTSPIRNAALSLLLFSFPLFQSFGISNFCEPYLLLLTTAMVYELVAKKNSKWVSHLFFAGVFTKYSFAALFPMIFFDYYLQSDRKINFKSWFLWLVDFLKLGKWWIILWIVFSALNEQPFLSVFWLNALLPNGQPSINPIVKIYKWVLMLKDALIGIQFWLPAFLIYVSGLIWMFLNRKKNRHFYMLGLTSVLAFLILPFSGAQFFDRYLFSFFPWLFLIIGITFQRWVSIPTLICVVALCLVYPIHKNSLGGSPRLGRECYTLRRELNKPSVILHDQYLWVTRLFRDHLISSGCTGQGCIEEMQKGVKLQHSQYVFKDEVIQHVLPDSNKLSFEKLTTNIKFEEISYGLLSAFRIKKAVEIIGVSNVVGSENPKNIYDGSKFEYNLKLKKKIPLILNPEDKVKIIVQFWVHDLHEDPAEFNQPRYKLMAKVESFSINDHEYVDLVMPYFFKSYSLPLLNLNEVWQDSKWLMEPMVENDFLKLKKVSMKI